MSRNSSLESQAFVMRTFTGNRLLLMIARSDSKEDAGKYSNGVRIGREGRGILSFFLLSAFLSSALHFAAPFTMTLKMTTALVVETSVTVNNNSPIQDYIHPDDQTQPTFDNLFYVYMAHAQHQKPQGDKKNALASTKGHLSTTAISLQRSLYKVAVVEKFNVINSGC